MAIYVANKTGRWDAPDTWLTSSRPWSEIATTASGWVTATTAPTLNDDVYSNGFVVTLSSASGYVHEATTITTRGVYSRISPAAFIIRSADNSYFTMDKHAFTYYITCSSIDGGHTSATANVSIPVIRVDVSQSIFYISSSLYNSGQVSQFNPSNTYGAIFIMSTAHSSSLYINGDIHGGSNPGTIYINSANRCNIIVTGSLYGGQNTTTVAAAIASIGQFTSCSISGSLIADSGPCVRITNSGSYIRVNGDVYASNSSVAITGSINSALSQSINIFGNIVNHPITAQQAIVGSRVYLTGSSISSVQIKPYPNSNITMYDESLTVDTTPAEANVYKGVTYGNNNSKTGLLTTPNVADVRSNVSYYTGSAGSTPTSQLGQCYMPDSSSVRTTINYDVTTNLTGGAMVVPTQNQVQYGVFFSTGSLTGSYQSTSQYWSTSSDSFTQVSSSGYLLSRSLDTTLGSITASFVADLNDVSITSNTIRRIQNIHTTQSVSHSIGSYE